MSSACVVKTSDESEQSVCYLLPCIPLVAPDEFNLDGFEESAGKIKEEESNYQSILLTKSKWFIFEERCRNYK